MPGMPSVDTKWFRLCSWSAILICHSWWSLLTCPVTAVWCHISTIPFAGEQLCSLEERLSPEPLQYWHITGACSGEGSKSLLISCLLWLVKYTRDLGLGEDEGKCDEGLPWGWQWCPKQKTFYSCPSSRHCFLNQELLGKKLLFLLMFQSIRLKQKGEGRQSLWCCGRGGNRVGSVWVFSLMSFGGWKSILLQVVEKALAHCHWEVRAVGFHWHACWRWEGAWRMGGR